MIHIIKQAIKKILRKLNYELLRINIDNKQLIYEYFNLNSIEKIKTNLFFGKRPELTHSDIQIVKYIFQNDLTMVSPARLIDTMLAVRYVNDNKINGAFVECGTWRGGNSIAASLVCKSQSINREFYIYDTFTGMSKPNDEIDQSIFHNESSVYTYKKNQENDHNLWCYSSLKEVKNNFKNASLSLENIKFVEGMVENTLKISSNLPDRIAVLRLDTDWYESTLTELEYLYPKLESGGIILIDDYGYWDGARKAVDEFFSKKGAPLRPFFAHSDFTGRLGIKK